MVTRETSLSQAHHTLRLVIADDEPRARLALKALLAAAAGSPGQRRVRLQVVGEASNGQEAIQQTAALRPDIVVLDCRMPIVDGLAATAAIKAEWPTTRVVVLTLYPSQRAAALAAGADAFLLKGCPAQDIFAALVNQPPADTDRP